MAKKRGRAKKRDLDEVISQAGSEKSEEQASTKRAIDTAPKMSKQGMLAFGGPQKHVPGSKWG